MKRSIKYMTLIFVFIFMFISRVTADEIDTCYYNFTGLSPSGDIKEDALFKVEIVDNGRSARGSGMNEFNLLLGSTSVLNWGTDKYGIDAKNFYVQDAENHNKCAEYAVYYRKFIDNNLYLFDHNAILNISDTDTISAGFSFNSQNIFKLINTSEDVNIEEAKTGNRVCEYVGFDIIYNKNNNVIKISNTTASPFVIYPSVELNMDSSSIDLCQPVYVCKLDGSNNVAHKNYDNFHSRKYIFYSSSDAEDMGMYKCEVYSPKSNVSSNSVCLKFSNLLNGTSSRDIKGMKDYWETYEECKQNNNQACISEALKEYKTKKDSLKAYCNSILNNRDVGDPCVDRCLNLNEDIYKLESGTSGDNDSTCGFSENLVIWIANIIRWVKYIVPVIVIVLGIIDFIRAIASDKDDEMKKAQGRFIKRLIAAALIFIVPFIIEFVLDKMGFTSNGCGIIDL